MILAFLISFRDGGPDMEFPPMKLRDRTFWNFEPLTGRSRAGLLFVLSSTANLRNRFAGSCLHLADVALHRARYSMSEGAVGRLALLATKMAPASLHSHQFTPLGQPKTFGCPLVGLHLWQHSLLSTTGSLNDSDWLGRHTKTGMSPFCQRLSCSSRTTA